jgi:AcrR family transcriptional regulator
MGSRRKIILEVAEQLFGEQGLQGTTVALIARAAGVGVGTVYLEFGSKDDIILALSEAKFGYVLRAMRQATMAQGGFSERLAAMMEARTRALGEATSCGAHGVELLHCEAGRVCEARESFWGDQLELIVDFLKVAQDAGEFRSGDPIRLAQTILHAYGIFVPPMSFHIPPDQLRELMNSMHDVVLNGMRSR